VYPQSIINYMGTMLQTRVALMQYEGVTQCI
jgi:hypothetical protein